MAALWLVHDLGGSTAITGVASFLFLVPGALMFAVGPLVDRCSVRWTLVTTQAAQGLLILAVPVTDALGYLSVGVVLAVVPLASLLILPTVRLSRISTPQGTEYIHEVTAGGISLRRFPLRFGRDTS